MKSIHNRTSFLLSLIGGTLLIVSGTTGAVSVLDEMWAALDHIFGREFVLTFEIITGILGTLTVFAGIAIVLGGVLLTTSHVEVGRIVILVAVGVGAFGLGLSLFQAVLVGNILMEWGLQICQSVGWIGAILAIDARIIADQRPMTDGIPISAASTVS